MPDVLSCWIQLSKSDLESSDSWGSWRAREPSWGAIRRRVPRGQEESAGSIAQLDGSPGLVQTRPGLGLGCFASRGSGVRVPLAPHEVAGQSDVDLYGDHLGAVVGSHSSAGLPRNGTARVRGSVSDAGFSVGTHVTLSGRAEDLLTRRIHLMRSSAPAGIGR